MALEKQGWGGHGDNGPIHDITDNLSTKLTEADPLATHLQTGY